MRVRQAAVYIDRQALQYNLNRVKQLAANSKIVSMVRPMHTDMESKTV